MHLSKKKIKGKYYYYLVKTMRLPNGEIIKISKLVKDHSEANTPEIEAFFEQKEVELLSKYAQKYYAPFRLQQKDAFEKIEKMRLEYKKILRKLSPAQLKDLFDRFTVNFTYESNAIEGNSLTLKDVAIVLHENASIKGKTLCEIYETRNSREVVDLILKRKFKVTEKDILKMHTMLVRDMGVPPGYKTVPNYIQNRNVVTTLPENVPKEMGELLKWFEKNKRKLHPLQLAVKFHGKFEQIHPFEDGNGRVGRFLLNAILVNAGYPPIIIRKTQRISYFNALEDSDDGRSVTLERVLYARLKETHEKFFKIYAKYLR